MVPLHPRKLRFEIVVEAKNGQGRTLQVFPIPDPPRCGEQVPRTRPMPRPNLRSPVQGHQSTHNNNRVREDLRRRVRQRNKAKHP